MTNSTIEIQAEQYNEVVENTDIVNLWIDSLHKALAAGEPNEISSLFTPNATVRDLLAFSWDFRNAEGRLEIGDLLGNADKAAVPEIWIRDENRFIEGEENGEKAIGTFLGFKNQYGSGDGYVRLLQRSCGAWQAVAFVLKLDQLDQVTPRTGENRAIGRQHGAIMDRKSWPLDQDFNFETKDPTVVILGAGHNGAMLAARLKVLGVPTLVIEKNDRVGDNWRNRYTSLCLHTANEGDAFPYLPYPPTWTKFTPKDKLADFIESYTKILDLPVWTGSEVSNVHFDEASKKWSMDVTRADGTVRKLHPAHLVFSTGLLGQYNLPTLPGMDEFQGKYIHAVQYRGYNDWIGKKVVVIGTGASGHDTAQDLAEHGVDVTLIQRSPTLVMSTDSFHKVQLANYVGGTYSTDEADLVGASVPWGLYPNFGAGQLKQAKEYDRELLDGLEKAGFKLSDGPNGQGALGLIFTLNGNGYYYNVGASELIIEGKIKLEHGNVTGMTKTGIVLNDDKTIDADLVIFATGYKGARASIRDVLGDEITESLGDFAEVGSDREFGRLFRQSGIPNLWFGISLGLDAARFYSQLLALQIAAYESGLIPTTDK